MTIYISGPMTDYPGLNRQAFQVAASVLEEAGYDVVNPAANHTVPEGYPPGDEWTTYMRHDITMLMLCDGVAMLRGWVASRGAQLEVHIAMALKMPCFSVGEWVGQAARRKGVI